MGSVGRRNFCLRLTTASSQCLSLSEHFFHCCCCCCCCCCCAVVVFHQCFLGWVTGIWPVKNVSPSMLKRFLFITRKLEWSLEYGQNPKYYYYCSCCCCICFVKDCRLRSKLVSKLLVWIVNKSITWLNSHCDYYAPTPSAWALSDDAVCLSLSDVCLSRTLGLSQEQRGLGRLKLA